MQAAVTSADEGPQQAQQHDEVATDTLVDI